MAPDGRSEAGSLFRTLRDWIVIAAFGLILFAGSVVVSHRIAPGDNYVIYQYISSFKNATGHYPSKDDGLQHPVDPAYHDYTPMNSAVYRAIFSLDQRYQQDVYIAYQVSMLVIGMICLRSLTKTGALPRDIFIGAMLFFLLNPLVYRMLAADDKTGFFMWPLLCLRLAAANAYAGAVAVGLFAGWTGLGAAAIPTLPSLVRNDRVKAFALLAVASLLFIALVFIEGAGSLEALHNRAARELMVPFSDSIWRWVPDALWPAARYPTILFFIGLLALLAWFGRIEFAVAAVAASSAYLLFSNNTVPTRLLFFIPLLTICFTTRASRYRYLVFAFIAVLVCHGLRRITPGFNPDATIGVALCNAIIVVPLYVVVARAVRRSGTQRTAPFALVSEKEMG